MTPIGSWKMFYPHTTGEGMGLNAYPQAGLPEIPMQNWHDQTLVSLVSAPTPAFQSESKTFQPVQVSQQDGPLHRRDQSSTTWVVDLHPFLQDIMPVVSFRVWQAESESQSDNDLNSWPSCKDISWSSTSGSMARSTSLDKVGKELYGTSSGQKLSWNIYMHQHTQYAVLSKICNFVQ